ncbi:DinB/UmuC family translesion DNA polymerase [Collinsella ihumii]|uniref:DinB/UmuC family translesion DNA polymerase n=1 Tax=Collinsella ihumii TaxID=1720204 RepID=UPI000830997B|nr:hypothetical protein [Collinsella ihumii]
MEFAGDEVRVFKVPAKSDGATLLFDPREVDFVESVNRAKNGTVRGKRAYGYAEASRKLGERTNSFKRLMARFDALFDEIVDPSRPIKRINIGFGGLLPEEFATIDLFTDVQAEQTERNLAEAVLAVRDRYGKNSLLRGTSYKDEATGRNRNEQVGGHHA